MVASVRVKDRQKTWVIFDPETKQFVGARWIEGKHSLLYSLGDFDTSYKCDSQNAAEQTLNVVQNFSQYSVLSEAETKRIEIRRVRSRILIIAGEKPPWLPREKSAPPTAIRERSKSRRSKRRGKK